MVVKNQSPEMTFDMRFHAFVMAVPRRMVGHKVALGQPVIAMNGGDNATLVLALRTIADDIERDGVEEAMRFTV